MTNSITSENYTYRYFQFQDRQAGISLVFSPEENVYYYNVYCIETKLLKELFSVEYEFLEDALATVNQEFGQWEAKDHETKSGCGDCSAKKH